MLATYHLLAMVPLRISWQGPNSAEHNNNNRKKKVRLVNFYIFLLLLVN